MLQSGNYMSTQQVHIKWDEWVRLHAGTDYPREVDWLEVRKIFGGGIMAVGMD